MESDSSLSICLLSTEYFFPFTFTKLKSVDEREKFFAKDLFQTISKLMGSITLWIIYTDTKSLIDRLRPVCQPAR